MFPTLWGRTPQPSSKERPRPLAQDAQRFVPFAPALPLRGFRIPRADRRVVAGRPRLCLSRTKRAGCSWPSCVPQERWSPGRHCRQALWPDKVCGDFEGGLHAAVRKLRRALNDDGSEPRLIGTLPRRGYRLLVPVTVVEDRPELVEGNPGNSDSAAPVVSPPREDHAAPSRRAGKSRLFLLLGLFLALLSAGALFWKPWRPWPRSVRTLALPGGREAGLGLSPGGGVRHGLRYRVQGSGAGPSGDSDPWVLD